MLKRSVSSDVVDEKTALSRAAALCSAREYCVSEIAEKLSWWGQSAEAQERILCRLQEEGYIDEARFCRAYALDKMRYNHWGRMKIGQSLRMLGVPDSYREQALRELPSDEYDDILRHIIQAKLPTIKARSAYERNGKLMRFLLGRGFEMSAVQRILDTDDDFSDINTKEIKDALQENISENDDAAQAEIQAAEFENIFKGGDNVQVLRGENKFAIRDEFKESVEGLKIPQFFREVTANLFEREYVLLEKEHLSEKFTLDKQDANINFSISPDDLYKIDIYEEGDALPQYKKIIGREREQFINYLETLPSKNKINQCVMAITQIINNNTGIASVKIKPYVRKVIDGMDEGKISVISRQYQFYASRIQQKIISLQEDFRKKTFSRWLDTGEIICQNSFELPPIIDAPKNIDSIPKSLYAAEVSDMNTLERRMIDELITFENVKWWHRNISRKEFKVNGFINHYPDFMIMTNSGKILMIETKGDDRDNSDSKEKLELGRKWQARAGLDYKYFMVFGNNKINADGAYNFEEFLDVVSEL